MQFLHEQQEGAQFGEERGHWIHIHFQTSCEKRSVRLYVVNDKIS
jgi:hypothetical protein